MVVRICDVDILIEKYIRSLSLVVGEFADDDRFATIDGTTSELVGYFGLGFIEYFV